jgi:hypothetical protein
MVGLLRYLEAHGFTCFIASGGSRDFMRAITSEIYSIPPERVVGSSNGLRYLHDEHGGSLTYLAEPDVFDDGAGEAGPHLEPDRPAPDRRGRHSNGDIEMLRYAGGKARAALRLLVLHDDAEREFDYTAGADRALKAARAEGWTVVSVRDDWSTVFTDLA